MHQEAKAVPGGWGGTGSLEVGSREARLEPGCAGRGFLAQSSASFLRRHRYSVLFTGKGVCVCWGGVSGKEDSQIGVEMQNGYPVCRTSRSPAPFCKGQSCAPLGQTGSVEIGVAGGTSLNCTWNWECQGWSCTPI